MSPKLKLKEDFDGIWADFQARFSSYRDQNQVDERILKQLAKEAFLAILLTSRTGLLTKSGQKEEAIIIDSAVEGFGPSENAHIFSPGVCIREENTLILEIFVPAFILDIWQEKARSSGEREYEPIGSRDNSGGERDEYFEKNFVKAGAFIRQDPRFAWVPKVVFPLYRVGSKEFVGNLGEKMWSVQKRAVDEGSDEKHVWAKKGISKWRDMESVKFPSAGLENFRDFLRKSFENTGKGLLEFIAPLRDWVMQVQEKPKLLKNQMIGTLPVSQAVRRLEDFWHNISTEFKSDDAHNEHLGWTLCLPGSSGPVLRGVGSMVNLSSVETENAFMALIDKPAQFTGTTKTCRYRELGRGSYTEKGKLLTSKEEKKLKHCLKDLGF